MYLFSPCLYLTTPGRGGGVKGQAIKRKKERYLKTKKKVPMALLCTLLLTMNSFIISYTIIHGTPTISLFTVVLYTGLYIIELSYNDFVGDNDNLSFLDYLKHSIRRAIQFISGKLYMAH